MEKVIILNRFIMEGCTLYEVIPEGFISFGGKKNIFCFDYVSLTEQWNISRETLDTVASYDIVFKQAMYVNYSETEAGQVKTLMLDAEFVPALLTKLKDSTYKPGTDIARERALIAELIKNAKEYTANGKSKSNAR
jgi:hypothetical protein